MKPLPSLAAAVAAALLTPAPGALAQSDDFNDANDTGWTRYNPLAAFGAGATYSFPSGGYRIQAPASPSPDLLGPARAGSLFPAQSFDRVRVEADVFSWDNELRQSVGLVARVGNLGLGTTTGYTFNYNPVSGFHQINLVLNENPAQAVSESLFRLDPTHRYRVTFTTVGDRLLGCVFSPTNSAIPLHSVVGIDATHASGRAGVFVFSIDAAGRTDGRFDNYNASVPPQVRATVLGATPAIGEQFTEEAPAVVVRLADMETALQRDSLRLTVNGVETPAELAEFGPVLQLTGTPAQPLDPARAHTASIRFRDSTGEQVFSWSFGTPAAPAPTLLSSATLAGPFEPATTAVLDAPNRRFSVPAAGEQRFYRISDATARTLKSVSVTNGNAVITFE